MARVITKELALKIVRKLKASLITAKSKAHDLYEVEYRGLVVAFISIRRGSAKDLGHDYISKDLHISTGNARRLAQCPLSRDGYMALLREQGLLPLEHGNEPERA